MIGPPVPHIVSTEQIPVQVSFLLLGGGEFRLQFCSQNAADAAFGKTKCLQTKKFSWMRATSPFKSTPWKVASASSRPTTKSLNSIPRISPRSSNMTKFANTWSAIGLLQRYDQLAVTFADRITKLVADLKKKKGGEKVRRNRPILRYQPFPAEPARIGQPIPCTTSPVHQPASCARRNPQGGPEACMAVQYPPDARALCPCRTPRSDGGCRRHCAIATRHSSGGTPQAMRATGTTGKSLRPLLVPIHAGLGNFARRGETQTESAIGSGIPEENQRKNENSGDFLKEAPPGFEPGLADLQSAALPLG